MKLAFELITNLTMHFAPHHKFIIYLKQEEDVLEDSRGEDTFDYNGMLLPDYPVTATGRKALHRYEPGLTVYCGTPGCPIEISMAEDQTFHDIFKNLTLWVDNNSILSQGHLQTYFSLKVHINGREFMVPLISPFMRIHWEGQGLFKIYLDSLVSLLY